jgi:hypothetical protein
LYISGRAIPIGHQRTRVRSSAGKKFGTDGSS